MEGARLIHAALLPLRRDWPRGQPGSSLMPPITRGQLLASRTPADDRERIRSQCRRAHTSCVAEAQVGGVAFTVGSSGTSLKMLRTDVTGRADVVRGRPQLENPSVCPGTHETEQTAVTWPGLWGGCWSAPVPTVCRAGMKQAHGFCFQEPAPSPTVFG